MQDPTRLSPGRAGLALELVDAPNPQVREINVTIDKVTAHSNTAGWVTVFDQGPVTVDLLTLRTRVMQLGFANLPVGRISQIRLYLVEGGPQNVVLQNGDVAPLKVPSGVQSGIKIKGPFELTSCDITTVTLDFDGHKSIWYHPTGNGGDWILRPVIRTKKVRTAPGSCDGTPDGGGTGGGNGTTGGGSGSTGGGSGSTGGGAGTTGGGTGGGLDENGGGGTPLPQQPGTTCSLNSQCLSAVCQAGRCATGAQGTPCRVGPDCASGTCGGDGSCTAPAIPTGAPGQACTFGAQCTSGICGSNGTCSPGLQGQPCNATSDCDSGYVCAAGFCDPELN